MNHNGKEKTAAVGSEKDRKGTHRAPPQDGRGVLPHRPCPEQPLCGDRQENIHAPPRADQLVSEAQVLQTLPPFFCSGRECEGQDSQGESGGHLPPLRTPVPLSGGDVASQVRRASGT